MEPGVLYIVDINQTSGWARPRLNQCPCLAPTSHVWRLRARHRVAGGRGLVIAGFRQIVAAGSSKL
eukprot:3594687-Lingulodinium_polyedra.AAC.1